LCALDILAVKVSRLTRDVLYFRECKRTMRW